MRLQQVFVCSCLLFCSVTASAGDKKPKPDLRIAPPPQGVYGAVDGSARFQNAEYYKLFMHDGIKSSDPKVLYGVMQDAATAGENYKALYLARIFTEMKPDLAAGWNNRAALANSLGLRDEAAACAIRVTDPTSKLPIPLSVLPGSGLKVKPVTFADWAAAMALVGDSLAAHNGERDVVAVRDDISGLNMADLERVRKNDADLVAAGLTPTGPYATVRPLQVEAVGANLFVLKNPDPMSYTTVKKMKMFGAFAMAMASGYTGDATGAQAAGQMMGDAMEVESNYKGGSYEKGTFDDGSKMLMKKDKPKSSGKEYAVGNPVTILWASGPSLMPNFFGRWDTKKNPIVTVSKPGQAWDPNAKSKPIQPAHLYYPRLMSFCDGLCSKPVSAMEAILTPSDVAKLSPGLSASLIDLTPQRQSYAIGKLTIASGNAQDSYVGFDENGAVYKIQLTNSQPTGWLVEP